MKIVIEKWIPIPVADPTVMEVLSMMEIGDSILLPKRPAAMIDRVQKKTMRRFMCRKVADGFRIWRTE